MHGPYYQLTRKVAGKTVTTRLTAGQAARYAEWIANQRELRRLIAEMEQVSRQAARLILSESPETGKRPEISPPNTGTAPRQQPATHGQRVLSVARFLWRLPAETSYTARPGQVLLMSGEYCA